MRGKSRACDVHVARRRACRNVETMQTRLPMESKMRAGRAGRGARRLRKRSRRRRRRAYMEERSREFGFGRNIRRAFPALGNREVDNRYGWYCRARSMTRADVRSRMTPPCRRRHGDAAAGVRAKRSEIRVRPGFSTGARRFRPDHFQANAGAGFRYHGSGATTSVAMLQRRRDASSHKRQVLFSAAASVGYKERAGGWRAGRVAHISRIWTVLH
jgi:hypothetical protein